MMHRSRRWVINQVAAMEELATMLSKQTWTLCSGFFVAGHPAYVFLNDATSENSAAEFAVVHGGIDAVQWSQFESISFSWVEAEKALEYIQRTLAGEFNNSEFASDIDLKGQLDRPEVHRRCHLCA